MTYKLDKVDKEILEELLKNSRTPYQEMAKKLIVSNGTIHIRINKMKDAGVITGSKITIDPKKLGLGLCAFIGINLVNAGDYTKVVKKLKTFPEVVDIHFTTGQYSIFIKVLTKDTQDFHEFLLNKLQPIAEVQSTETLISLDNPLNREITIN